MFIYGLVDLVYKRQKSCQLGDYSMLPSPPFSETPVEIWVVVTQIFFYIWRAYFSNGLKPPTSF